MSEGINAALEFRNVDILFDRGNRRGAIEAALARLDAGETREEIGRALKVTVGVAGANLAVARGEISVLMGLSGSGKSTLLRAANRLNRPIRGEVRIGNGLAWLDIARCDDDTLRTLRKTRIAMVFQQFGLLPWRTVRDNVGFGLELRGMAPSIRRDIVAEKLELVGLANWADAHVHELSGGMQQRVGLARAFATDADILLMDEPFSALDPLIRRKLQDELLDLQKRLKKTILFVSHDIDEALKIGSRITIMREGRIVQTGTPDDIALRPVDDYVAEFIRHMNPLPTIVAAAVMRRFQDLPRRPDGMLDGGRIAIAPDAAIATIADRALAIRSHGAWTQGALCVVPAQLSLGEIIALRQRSGLPVLVEAEGRLVGLCDDADILQALCGEARFRAG
ncbi:ATP-binding cassette domain-containing protein [Gluconacetobacter aggeris]|uniref:ATP-binding cassette domain-containing protein n=1 Tax=Gluconacetobacter aggeris TaxID=1286186 RepID=A0A7W4NYI4_9PROT|nr:ATP-binding cassette domain-containing protein [Gluconacetobacter aggeris]